MVVTRARQPTMLVDAGTAEKGSAPEHSPRPEVPKQNKSVDEGNGTIGSRLRKRRRTGSTPAAGTPPIKKRPNTRHTTSPEDKRSRAEMGPRATATSIEPLTNGTRVKSPSLTPLASSSISQAPSEMSRVPSPASRVSARASRTPAEDFILQQQQERPIFSTTAPELAMIIEDIIDHGEHVDSLRGYDEMGFVDTESLPTLGASLHLKTQSLPILDNLATQILNSLAKATFPEIITIVTDPDSDPGETYATLKGLFDHTKKVYAIADPFLNPYELGLVDQAHIDTIRKANLATFVSSVFGSQEVGFYHLNEYFLDTFVADGNRLLKSQAQLFLDLKTQAYISAMSNGERTREEILEDLFPADLEERLLSRRPGAKQLAPSEADFLQRARNRSKGLLEEPDTEEAIAALPDKYVWEDFLRDVTSYISKNFEMIVGVPAARKIARSRPSNGLPIELHQQQQQTQQLQHYQQQPAQQYSQHQNHVQPTTENQNGNQIQIDTDDIAEKAARAAQYAMQGFGMPQEQQMPQQPQQPPTQQQQVHQQHPQQFHYHFEHQGHPLQQPPSGYYHPQMNGHPEIAQHQAMYGDQAGIPYPTQTAPTQVLYERARMAATAKASPSSRRAGTPSQRRPWTTEEENALMAGLDRVKGPHWSQILAMFGPGGTINESLKDRNQVQLKDKARNLKLFFLKSGIEVPYYLQFVTGELKTRAPAQAAKNEAKAREQRSEDRGHIEAVLTLAGGTLQNGTPDVDGVEDGTPAVNGGGSENDAMNVGQPESEDQKPLHLSSYEQPEQLIDASAPVLHSVEVQQIIQSGTNDDEDLERALSASLDADAAKHAAAVQAQGQEPSAAAVA
ncbi:TTAGGG repeat binding factor [Lignoscripta atroalba]|nr:TTAGGG repeat binding factor [Lignoscripta atroalba]